MPYFTSTPCRLPCHLYNNRSLHVSHLHYNSQTRNYTHPPLHPSLPIYLSQESSPIPQSYSHHPTIYTHQAMPTDLHGTPHTGNLGLFDDDSEQASALARAERHEHARLEGVIRRHERHQKRQFAKEAKAASRAAQRNSASKLPSPLAWMGRLFGSSAKDGSGGERMPESKMEREEYVIVRREEKPEKVYTREDVDPVESIWLRECGMVRVKSGDPGGCHIVPESGIRKNE